MKVTRTVVFLHGLILSAICFHFVVFTESSFNAPNDAHTATASPIVSTSSSQSRLGYVTERTENVLDETVRLLLPHDQADAYIGKFPGKEFRFFVYSLPAPYTWQAVSSCIENQVWKNVSNCDWGSSVCTEIRSSSPLWSRRRFNRNGDIVIAKLLDEYDGPLRTNDPTQADLFVVPYPR